MRRWEDDMCRCEDQNMWRWEDDMCRCEDAKVWKEEDGWQTPTIRRTLRSVALGNKYTYMYVYIHI